MISIFNYLIVSSIYLVTFYLFYTLALSGDTQFRRNRIYLLLSVSLSLILPLIKISFSPGFSGPSQTLQGVIHLGDIIVRTDAPVISSMSVPGLLLALYFSGALLSLFILIIRSAGIFKIIMRSKSQDKIISTNNSKISGFSAFGYVFIYSGLNCEDREKILKHEQIHVDGRHYIDLMLIKVASVLLWFNPAIYLVEKSLRIVHEYEADNTIISNGVGIAGYQRLILDQAFNTHIFSIQNGFSGRSLIKKRIIMMTKERNGKIAGLKILLVIPVVAIFILMFSCTAKETEPLETVTELKATEAPLESQVPPKELTEVKEKQVFVVVEEMPTFLGGDIDFFRLWVMNNVKYPKIAVENGIQGKVYIMFVVNTDGTVSDVEVLRGVDPVLDKEAIRVVESSPNWVAGKQSSKLVNVKFAITVNFQLN